MGLEDIMLNKIRSIKDKCAYSFSYAEAKQSLPGCRAEFENGNVVMVEKGSCI